MPCEQGIGNCLYEEKIAAATEASDIFIDLGAASSEIVNIMAKAEERFGIEFDDDDIDDLGSALKDSIDLVEKTLAENNA